MSDYPARYWHQLDSGKIQCDLCPRNCKLKEDQRGICFVRKREGDHMVLTTYGRSSGFCVDPVEKKPLNHFYPGTPVLSFGTAGCNLCCKFCQNWDISKSKDIDRLTDQASPEDIAFAAQREGCTSIAVTYNDPVIFLEYVKDVAEACHRRGIKVIAVSAGYINPEPRVEFYSFVDAVNIDLKGFTEKFYKTLASAHLEPVLDTLRYIRHETDVWLEITTLLIPDENDGPEEVTRLSEWVARELGPETPLHFSAFHPDYKMMDKPPTPLKTLIRARNIAMEVGLKYVYTGNVHYTPGDTTFCAHCGETLIIRDWYNINGYYLTPKGACPSCGQKAVGCYEAEPGNWGAHRKPIQIGTFW
ncbi:MAG: AmmeMemoRadiSam system radical SAM enzyme [SAR324 cluster bacterium]|uniref:AmmeMemoRadiSam system radical SAM enzyme n=1 Tax=SAR324 cluster bacterium TaxID=2024889 RepID=A0A2A4T7J3_9DELT|nr:MAG: AmmeMemoRadiSam system radical SAM enzyme [SAR324 cluster bacterium]